MQEGNAVPKYNKPTQYARLAAWETGRNRGVYNANGKPLRAKTAENRAAMANAARTAFKDIREQLVALKASEPECALITEADIDFLSLAFSQLLTEEQINTLALPETPENTGAAGGWRANGNSQSGGVRRFKQKGGALGQAIMNFFRAICGRAQRYTGLTNAAAAANVQAVSRAIDEAPHEDITRNLILGMTTAGAVGTVLTGKNGMATLALTALNIVRSILPDASTAIANTTAGISAWGPVAAAAIPVAANLAIISACFIAIRETNKFVFGAAKEGLVFLQASDYKGFLVELCKRLYSVLARSVTGGIQTRMNRVAVMRNAVSASAAASASPAEAAAIEAAVDAALATSPGLAPILTRATEEGAAGNAPAPAPAAVAALSVITEEEADAAADAIDKATVAGQEELARQSQAGSHAMEQNGEDDEGSQETGFRNLPIPTFPNNNNRGRPALLRGAPGGGGAPSVSGFTFRTSNAANSGGGGGGSSGGGAKRPRTLTAAAEEARGGGGGGGGGGAREQPKKKGKSRKQQGGKRNIRKNRKTQKKNRK